jgi:hypothetical protein
MRLLHEDNTVMVAQGLTIANMAVPMRDTEAPRKTLEIWNVPSANVDDILNGRTGRNWSLRSETTRGFGVLEVGHI